ncbi:SUMO protein smt3 [Diaporthe eres]|uniref:SUMO protein smt3 n=1 Tax=Diaporthe eres TaxID=83184 RepID=A0ABR1PBR6_DIAER
MPTLTAYELVTISTHKLILNPCAQMSFRQHTSNSPAAEGQEAPAQTEHLSIKVTDNNNELVFKIKKSTKLEKLIDSFCERHGKDPGSVRFLFEGDRIKKSDTPDSLEMEDGDTIEVFYEQTGGNGLCTVFRRGKPYGDDTIAPRGGKRAESENTADDDTVNSTAVATPTDGNPPAKKQKLAHESDVTEKESEVLNEGGAAEHNGGRRDGLAEVEGWHGEESRV